MTIIPSGIRLFWNSGHIFRTEPDGTNTENDERKNIMPKGCQKKIYYLKNLPGRYFEEAYLILKRDLPENRKPASPDLACEADRIIRDAASYFSPPPKTRYFSRGVAFALGAASSSALIGTIALIIGLA